MAFINADIINMAVQHATAVVVGVGVTLRLVHELLMYNAHCLSFRLEVLRVTSWFELKYGNSLPDECRQQHLLEWNMWYLVSCSHEQRQRVTRPFSPVEVLGLALLQ